MLVIVVGMFVGVRTTAVYARHRAESAADLAALAAAARIGVDGTGCAVARRVAAANGGQLRSCTADLGPDWRNGTVVVRVAVSVALPVVGMRVVVASARAGRSVASTP